MPALTLKQANVNRQQGIRKSTRDEDQASRRRGPRSCGNIVSAQREDGASMFRMDVAKGKAWGAVAMGASSRALGKRARDNPNFF